MKYLVEYRLGEICDDGYRIKVRTITDDWEYENEGDRYPGAGIYGDKMVGMEEVKTCSIQDLRSILFHSTAHRQHLALGDAAIFAEDRHLNLHIHDPSRSVDNIDTKCVHSFNDSGIDCQDFYESIETRRRHMQPLLSQHRRDSPSTCGKRRHATRPSTHTGSVEVSHPLQHGYGTCTLGPFRPTVCAMSVERPRSRAGYASYLSVPGLRWCGTDLRSSRGTSGTRTRS